MAKIAHHGVSANGGKHGNVALSRHQRRLAAYRWRKA